MIGTPETREVAEAVDKIKPILAGRSADIQGAILADLLSMWVAGHFIPGDPRKTDELRRDVLAFHLSMIPTLIEINAKILGTAV